MCPLFWGVGHEQVSLSTQNFGSLRFEVLETIGKLYMHNAKIKNYLHQHKWVYMHVYAYILCNVNKYLNMQQIAQRFTCISSIMDHQPSQAGQPGCRMGRAGMAVCRARKERRGSGKSSSKSSAVGWRTSTEVFSPRQDVRPNPSSHYLAGP